ncbi:MAG: SurA N-terminal domain-containing protein [Kiritimatiellales bacterium]|nr:SurA N-terminal domain-containing protein [Kiritimatiellota bacterium]MBL7012082.1 SurA N-terminal domain-containing protein [Kiritimatiellales bacterium]
MTMMISKFHKLIQSKVVWYIVLGVIVIAFVGFFTPTMGNKSAKKKEQYVGKMFGEKISSQKLKASFNHTYLWAILTTGRMPDMNEENSRAMEEGAWQRMVLLHKAADEAVIVSDQEIIQNVQRMPIFMNKQGVFDKRVYDAILAQIGITGQQVENTVREQIAIQKLMYRPIQAALISSEELERAYHMYTDRLVFDYAVFPRAILEPEVTVSREEAEAFFAENMEAFRMPAKVRVSYVEYPVADFLAQADVPEGAALQFYNQNLEAYRIETTGDVSVVEYKAFEDVEDEITAIIAEFSARRLAADTATSLVADIAPKAQNEVPDFKGAATAAGLTVKTLPAFGPDDELSGIDATAPFKQAAFGLQDDIYSSFSDAVVGKESVYVISLEKRYESFLPGFDIVEKEVTKAARARAAAEAGAARVLEIRDAVAAALKNGSDFKTAVKPYGVKVQTTDEFDLTSLSENKYAEQLVQAGVSTPQGELCQIVPVEGGVLFSSVAQRKVVDAEIGLPAIRNELVKGLSNVRAQRLAADWQEQVMKEANVQMMPR